MVNVKWESAWTDPRKHGKPFFAVLSIDKEGKTKWNFVDGEMYRSSNQKEYKLEIETTLPEGSVIDCREGSSWKNDYRRYYIVDRKESNGLRYIGDNRYEAVKILKQLHKK